MIINKEVKNALEKGLPVVALESTIISHGMPYPRNVETALALETAIRENGAVPATIGIIDGEAVIGMNKDQIEAFGLKKGIVKVSRRDLPIVFANKLWGATTVAATMILANLAGIEVFVTGGVGGVHRGAQETFDVSADLQELARTNVTVVSAGIKAILDLPLTLEYLETMGVPVIAYQSNNLADFYTRDSGLKLENRCDSPKEVAKIILEKRKYQILNGGILISNPIPEKYSLNKKRMDEVIDEALAQAKYNNISGKETTPYLLKKIVELTGGDSLESNVKLVLNNAVLGAQIAIELAGLKKNL